MFGCEWVVPSVYNLGENSERKLVWHDFFTFRICEDPDFSFLSCSTGGAVRIDLMEKMERYLNVGVMAAHDQIIRHFAGSTPLHSVIGMYQMVFVLKFFVWHVQTILNIVMSWKGYHVVPKLLHLVVKQKYTHLSNGQTYKSKCGLLERTTLM